MSTPPAHTESSDHLDARLQLISASVEMKGAAASKPCWASFRDPNWEFGFHCNWKQTGNQFSLPSNAAINECSHNLLARLFQQQFALFSLLGFLYGNLNNTSLMQPQSRDLGEVNYTTELPLTGKYFLSCKHQLNVFQPEKNFSCWRVEGDTEEALESHPLIHGHFLLRRTSLLSLPWQETKTQVSHGG